VAEEKWATRGGSVACAEKKPYITVKDACAKAAVKYTTLITHLKTAELFFLDTDTLLELYRENPISKRLNRRCGEKIERDYKEAKKRAIR